MLNDFLCVAYYLLENGPTDIWKMGWRGTAFKVLFYTSSITSYFEMFISFIKIPFEELLNC